jgi:hypothetical protein
VFRKIEKLFYSFELLIDNNFTIFFTKGLSCGADKISKTNSEGQHNLTPNSVTTNGRLIKIGISTSIR